MNNWKAYFKPFRLYDNIVIKPTWEEVPSDVTEDDIVIEIDPGAAFGTGSHETTKLCIGQLKNYMKEGDAVFDCGSGSGILSFVCSSLGAKEVLGIDIDETAVHVSIENRDINHIPEEKVQFICGNILEDAELVQSIESKYDIVVAQYSRRCDYTAFRRGAAVYERRCEIYLFRYHKYKGRRSKAGAA